jgi:hypothetical protein
VMFLADCTSVHCMLVEQNTQMELVYIYRRYFCSCSVLLWFWVVLELPIVLTAFFTRLVIPVYAADHGLFLYALSISLFYSRPWF